MPDQFPDYGFKNCIVCVCVGEYNYLDGMYSAILFLLGPCCSLILIDYKTRLLREDMSSTNGIRQIFQILRTHEWNRIEDNGWNLNNQY